MTGGFTERENLGRQCEETQGEGGHVTGCCTYQLRDATDCQQTPDARSGEEGPPPEMSETAWPC